MAFSLNKVIDGQRRVFQLQKILEILGDSTNDEIILDGQAFRISSFIALNTGNGSGLNSIWLELIISVQYANQNQFNIGSALETNDSIQLFINGIYYPYNRPDTFHINNSILHWHGNFSLDVDDEIILKFHKSI